MGSLKIENVFKYYYSGKKLINAVRNLNLEVEDGKILSILGPSGCGKSSTMRMIAGLEQITDGNIFIDGNLINNLDPTSRNVALAFESYALYQHLTVKENISFCLKIRKMNKQEIEEKVNWIADLLDIKHNLDSKPSSLSGGQQQLASLARALVREPSITLLDEPISHLDTGTRIATSLKIRHINKETGLTMIYVTHNQEEALAIADQIAVMDQAELQQVGDRIDIIEKPKNIFVASFVGEPSINLLRCRIANDQGALKAIGQDDAFEILIDKRTAKAIADKDLKEVILGIRPIDILLNKLRPTDLKIEGKIENYEFLGERSIVKLKIKEKSDIVCVANPMADLGKGDRIELYLNIEKIHYFDPDTKLRIEA